MNAIICGLLYVSLISVWKMHVLTVLNIVYVIWYFLENGNRNRYWFVWIWFVFRRKTATRKFASNLQTWRKLCDLYIHALVKAIVRMKITSKLHLDEYPRYKKNITVQKIQNEKKNLLLIVFEGNFFENIVEFGAPVTQLLLKPLHFEVHHRWIFRR